MHAVQMGGWWHAQAAAQGVGRTQSSYLALDDRNIVIVEGICALQVDGGWLSALLDFLLLQLCYLAWYHSVCPVKGPALDGLAVVVFTSASTIIPDWGTQLAGSSCICETCGNEQAADGCHGHLSHHSHNRSG
jgi:hypothetical protein